MESWIASIALACPWASDRRARPPPSGYLLLDLHDPGRPIDIAEVRTEEDRLYLLVAIDRTSKFAFVELHQKVTTRVAGDYLLLIRPYPTRCKRF